MCNTRTGDLTDMNSKRRFLFRSVLVFIRKWYSRTTIGIFIHFGLLVNSWRLLLPQVTWAPLKSLTPY